MLSSHIPAVSRKSKKEEGKKRKRQLIAEAGGVRPRKPPITAGAKTPPSSSFHDDDDKTQDTKEERPISERTRTFLSRSPASASTFHQQQHVRSKHRFGRVMESVPCRNTPRFSTVSIALPGSVLANCQTKELRTLLVGQIARAATIYHIDEIIVFDDNLGKRRNSNDNTSDHHRHAERGGGGGWKDRHQNKDAVEGGDKKDDDADGQTKRQHDGDNNSTHQRPPRSDPQEFMARLLQYCECPQYLRRNFFPMHPDLQFAGLLAPIDAPHHVRADDRTPFREGVVMNKKGPNGNSLVNCGIPHRPVEIDRQLAPGIRCTVQLDVSAYGRPGLIRGTVVSPSTPRETNGTYWGFQTRLARSINDVFVCPFEESNRKYDLKIGTSERGDTSIEGDKNKKMGFSLPKYTHAVIVFGGVAGIEECVDADESIKLPGAQSRQLFDMWLNTCPFQGSRTIRTEEAVMISLATLSPFLTKSARNEELEQSPPPVEDEKPVEFSDEAPSEESSSGGSSEEEEEDSNDDDDEQ